RSSCRLLLSEARRELRPDGELRGGETQRRARFLLGDPFHLEQHPARTHDAHPLLGGALALAHSRFLRLLRDRLVREQPHPDLAPPLYEAPPRAPPPPPPPPRHPPPPPPPPPPLPQ